MTTQKYTIEKEGTICDICLKPIESTHMITWLDTCNLNRALWFRFKTMFASATGKAYDAHGQCAADILSHYIERRAIEKINDL
jgi:hypothetical protein